jgi:hypothetical protein
MSVDQPRVIDIISQNADGHIVLTISDHLEWDETHEHLLVLQEKTNASLAFVESGEIYEEYANAKGRPIRINVVFKHQPNLEARAFLAKAKAIVESAGFGFGFELFSAAAYTM